MHGLLFRHQDALADDDLLRYAAELGLDLAAFEADRADAATLRRVRRDVDSGMASGEVLGARRLCSSTGWSTEALTTRLPYKKALTDRAGELRDDDPFAMLAPDASDSRTRPLQGTRGGSMASCTHLDQIEGDRVCPSRWTVARSA